MKKKISKKNVRLHIRRDDVVKAISGDDADGKKTGKVLKVMPGQGRAIVEGFNIIKRHTRKSQDNPKGGIVEREAPVAVSKLALVSRPAAAAAKKAE